jgi:hypothetical protein
MYSFRVIKQKSFYLSAEPNIQSSRLDLIRNKLIDLYNYDALYDSFSTDLNSRDILKDIHTISPKYYQKDKLYAIIQPKILQINYAWHLRTLLDLNNSFLKNIIKPTSVPGIVTTIIPDEDLHKVLYNKCSLDLLSYNNFRYTNVIHID